MHNTFAARAGRWSTQHRKKAIFGWLAFVLIAVVVGGGVVGQKEPDTAQSRIGESGQALGLIDDHYPDQAQETVLVQSDKAGDPALRVAVDSVVAAVSKLERVEDVQSPFARGNDNQVSEDGKSVLVTFDLVGDESETEEAVEPVVAAVEDVAAANPAVFVGQFGGASASAALSEAFSDDFKKAEQTSVPITLLILLLAFGALVAAGVPLLLGVTAVAGTIGLLGPVSQLVPLDEMISSIVLLIGMAVGVDYTLFYLRREREEKAAGRTSQQALGIAAATSGRAILISGFTVMVAMAGMLFAGDRTFTALGIGSILVVAVAMIGSVTFVPALLAALGDKVEKGRVPFLRRKQAVAGEAGRGWTLVLDAVLKRPGVSALLAGGALVALTVPAFSMKTANTGIDDLPRDLEVMKVYDRMQAAFPGGQIPAVVVAEINNTGKTTRAVADLRRDALASGVVSEPIDVRISPDRKLVDISLPIRGDGTDAASEAALDKLRGDLVPRFEQTAGAQAFVAGITAESKDWTELMKDRAPIVFAFVLVLAFLLLLVTFRSIVIPIKAIVLNLLSVGASYGVLKLVFQDGRFESLLGYESMGAITAWLPMFLFVILFGLSMDYHVFILSRVREAFDSGMDTEAAVAHGIKSTASVVTSAALVMVAVFGIFATLSGLDFKMMGVGLATAIFLDATIVRGVLLPATMKLLGDWNWYLPKSLDWLPRVAHEPAPEPAR